MTGDPIVELRALAAEISDEDLTDTDMVAWRERIADRLDALIDRVVARPPLVSELIDYPGDIETQIWSTGEWFGVEHHREAWAALLAEYGDHLVYGYRLIPAPEPTTERVRLDQVIGRRLPEGDRIAEVWSQFSPLASDDDWWYVAAEGTDSGHHRLDVADDGTVEVLAWDET